MDGLVAVVGVLGIPVWGGLRVEGGGSVSRRTVGGQGRRMSLRGSATRTVRELEECSTRSAKHLRVSAGSPCETNYPFEKVWG